MPPLLRVSPSLALAVCASLPTAVPGTTIDNRPRQSLIFEDGGRFVAQDGWNSVALYRAADGSVVHRFPAPTWVSRLALSPDERHLLVACRNGALLLWQVETVAPAWVRQDTGLTNVSDVSFAANGGRFVVCDRGSGAVVFDTRTGDRVGPVIFAPGLHYPESAALAPDGTAGFVASGAVGGRLYRFDVATGWTADAGLRGGRRSGSPPTAGSSPFGASSPIGSSNCPWCGWATL